MPRYSATHPHPPQLLHHQSGPDAALLRRGCPGQALFKMARFPLVSLCAVVLGGGWARGMDNGVGLVRTHTRECPPAVRPHLSAERCAGSSPRMVDVDAVRLRRVGRARGL